MTVIRIDIQINIRTPLPGHAGTDPAAHRRPGVPNTVRSAL
jgi:hypothetical protein